MKNKHYRQIVKKTILGFSYEKPANITTDRNKNPQLKDCPSFLMIDLSE